MSEYNPIRVRTSTRAGGEVLMDLMSPDRRDLVATLTMDLKAATELVRELWCAVKLLRGGQL